MPGRTLFHHARLCSAESLQEDGWLLVQGRHIVRLGQGPLPPLLDAERIDLGNRLLCPGMIDLHVHGAMGCDTMDGTPEALRQMARFLAAHGVTSFLATTMTHSSDRILAALGNIAQVQREGTGGAALLGAHVEGPYLESARAGAQDPTAIRPADPAEYDRFFATGVVKLLTVASEIPANQPLVRRAVERGIAVAVGHSRASYEEMLQALAMGASQVTHLFNGMEPLHHRKPGVVGAALALEELRCQLIADNIHIHPAVLRLAVKAKGVDGIILISDAMSGTGMPDGAYDLGGQRVTVRQGAARIDSGALAGSTLTLEDAVRNIMAATGLSLPHAMAMATRTPARALAMQGRKGSLTVGMDADLIVLDDALNVTVTMVEGQVISRRPE